jgi:hypothetical protein
VIVELIEHPLARTIQIEPAGIESSIGELAPPPRQTTVRQQREERRLPHHRASELCPRGKGCRRRAQRVELPPRELHRTAHPAVPEEQLVTADAGEEDLDAMRRRKLRHRVVAVSRDVGDRFVEELDHPRELGNEIARRELGAVPRNAE